MRIIAVALAAVLLAAPAAEAKKRHCPSRGHTLAADARVRVFEIDGRDEARLYACVHRTGRTRRVPTDGDAFGSVRIAYPFVAYVEETAVSGFGAAEDLERFDLRVAASDTIVSVGGTTGVGIVDYVLARSGAVAWTAITGGHEVYVEKHDADGDAVLDQGFDIDGDSLALTRSGRRVYWMRGGAPRTATLR